jgi:hypothetical protein
MKNFTLRLILPVFLLCFVFINAASGQEKRVNIMSPIKSVNYTLANKLLRIEVTLRESLNTDNLTATELSKFELLPLLLTNEKRVSGKCPKQNNPDINSMVFIYLIEVWPVAGEDVFNELLRLQPTWENFSFTIPYSFRIKNNDGVYGTPQEYTSPTFMVYRSLIPPQEIELSVKQPAWSLDQNQKTEYLAVPIQANKDLRVQVDLRDNIQNIVVASGKELLRKQDEPQSVLLIPNRGQELVSDRPYTIEISSQSPEIKIAQASQKTLWPQARPTIIYKVEETSDNANQLLKLKKVTSPEKASGITITTTKTGSLKLVFDDGSMEPITGSFGTSHNFTIILKGKGEGTYPFHFEGTSQELEPLISSKKYSITIDTRTKIEGLIAFELDAQNNLNITYSIDRDVSKTSLTFSDLGGFSVPAKPVQGVTNRYTCALNLDAADNLIKKLKEVMETPENAQKNQVPIKFTVTVENSDRASQEIGSFSLLAYRVNQSKLVEALKTQLDEPKAKQTALDVLGYKAPPASGSNEESAVNYLADMLRKKPNDGGKQRFMGFLKFAGKVAAGYFGIAVPF